MKAFYVLLILVLLIASWTVLREPSSPNVATDESLSPKVETGEVLGIRHVTLKEGVDSDEFERFFVEEYQPVYNERFPGLQFMLLKGDRGQDVAGIFSYSRSVQFGRATTTGPVMTPAVGNMRNCWRPVEAHASACLISLLGT